MLNTCERSIIIHSDSYIHLGVKCMLTIYIFIFNIQIYNNIFISYIYIYIVFILKIKNCKNAWL